MVDWIQREKVVNDHFLSLEDHHQHLEESRHPVRQGHMHPHSSFPDDDHRDLEAAFSSETPDDTLSKVTSYDDDDNEDLLFEELTAEVVGALTEGMDDELADDINPYPHRQIDSVDLIPSFDTWLPRESDQVLNDNTTDHGETLDDDRFWFLSSNRAADKEKAQQWARRLDKLISESNNRSNSSTMERNVGPFTAAEDEFNNNPPSTQDLNTLKADRFCEVAGSDQSLSSVKTASNASLQTDDHVKKTISTQTDFPTVEFKGGIVCSSAEDAQDVLKTRYSLPNITVKKSLITWSRWNIRDVIRSPIGQGSLWHPTQDVLMEQNAETNYNINEINNEIERRAEAISKLILMKEAEREISAERAAAAMDKQRQATQGNPGTRHESDEAGPASDPSSQRRADASPENREQEGQEGNTSSLPPATFVDTGVNFIQRWCRYLSRPFSRRPRESTIL